MLPDDLDDVPPPTDADLLGAPPLDDVPPEPRTVAPMQTTQMTKAVALAKAEAKAEAAAALDAKVEAAAADEERRKEARQPRRLNLHAATEPDRPVLIWADPARVAGEPVPVLHLGITAILAGEGGVGKTALAAALAVSVATGAPWLCTHTPIVVMEGEKTKPRARFDGVTSATWGPAPDGCGGVLIVAAEEELNEISRRLRAACWEAARLAVGAEPGNTGDKVQRQLDEYLSRVDDRVMCIALAETPAEGDALVEVVKRTEPDPDDRTGATRITTTRVARQPLYDAVHEALNGTAPDGSPWRLVLLDPLVELLALESENDNRQVAAALRAGVHPLRRRPDAVPLVLALHHTAKVPLSERGGPPDASIIRGASAFVGSARWAAVATWADDGGLRLSVVKANYASRPAVELTRNRGAIRGYTAEEAKANGEAKAAKINDTKPAKTKAAKGTKKDKAEAATGTTAMDPEVLAELAEYG